MSEPELDELRAIAARAGIGEGTPVERLDEPPTALWERIESATAPVTPAKHQHRWVWPLAAAAAVAVTVGVVAVVVASDDDDPEPVATATLEPLGDEGSGSAELVEQDGELQLVLDTTDIDADDGFVEVWVIDSGVERLVSLGPLRPDGRYDLPPGLDPEAFPIVDVSREPLDGDPTHSGDSVLRGELEF
jgi:anti-sigma-K factor RskA